MRATVKRDKLVKIIKRRFPNYGIERINSIIDEYGASYFNQYSDLNIEYLGFGEWTITI